MLEEYFYSDMDKWPLYLAFFIGCFSTWIAAVATHELAHLMYFKFVIGKNVKLKIQRKPTKILVGNIEDYKDLNKNQYANLNIVGVLAGVIPIAVATYFFMWLGLVIIPYIYGCIPDLEEYQKAKGIVFDDGEE